MKIITDNIWDIYRNYDAICCTTNSVVKNNGELVMGAGIAKEFSNKYPWLSTNWGTRVKSYNPNSSYIEDAEKKGKWYYHPGLFVTLMNQRPHLVYFATKWDYKEKSDLKLIEHNIKKLCNIIDVLDWKKVLLPKPGCSNGGLNWETEVVSVLKYWLDLYPQIDILTKAS